jgi:aromatic ring-cleaving dioxygenase
LAAVLASWPWNCIPLSALPGVIFEHPSVADLPRKLLAERGLEERITVLSGDFNVDDIGDGYDLIIALGYRFCQGLFRQHDQQAESGPHPEGYLYLVSHDVSEDYQSPKESILGWLSSHLDGLDILLTKKTIESALAKHHFRPVQTGNIDGAFEHLQGAFYTKTK